MSDAPTSGGARFSTADEFVRIRAMRSGEAGQAAEWHQEEFPDGFYVRLGPRFLTTYYRGYVRSPYAVALVAVTSEDEIAGYLAGTVDETKHSRWMLWRYGIVLALVGFMCLVRQPALCREFVRSRALWYLRRVVRIAVGAVRQAPGGKSGELTYLVCSQTFRGRGIGTRLVTTFDRQAAIAGTRRLILVTTAGDQRVRGFYESLGWQSAGTRWTREGRELASFESVPAVLPVAPRPRRDAARWGTRSTIRRALAASTAIVAFATACTAQAELSHAPTDEDSPAGRATTPSPPPLPGPTPTRSTPTAPAPTAPARADARVLPVSSRQWARIAATG